VETIKRQIRTAYHWLVIDQSGCRLSLRPIDCTPLSLTWKALLQLRYVAYGAIHVLYAFAIEILFVC